MNNQRHRYFKFFIYFVVIVLVNLVSATLYYRVDLTRDKVYSLSEASQKVVATLSEPLTIKVFFSKNLPAPHNNTERYLHDLMDEYSSHGGKFFNYMFHDVTPKEAGLTDEADRNRRLAEDYGISPVQIRIIENDEVKFQQAYMGLVIIHGDMVEKVPAITATDGLEYRLTTAIQNLNNKVSTLLSLKEKVKVTMYLSSSLYQVAPLMGLDDLSAMPEEITRVVEGLNIRSLDVIDFKYIDPSKSSNLDDIAGKYNIMLLEWPDFVEQNIQAGRGGAGLVMEYGEKRVEIPLISSINLPIIGTTYQMADPSALEEIIADTMEKMIGINQAMGYLADHGTLPLSMPGMGMMGQQQQTTMNAFNHLISERYSMDEINLKDGEVPEGLNTLIIARPTQEFTDFQLFQIDQALMKGTNLAIFPDPFNETMPGQSAGFMGGGPVYEPIDTGLSKLLEHYGIKVSSSYVMDEECFKQVLPQNRGGGEQKIYFAPLIDKENINSQPEYMNNIKGMVVMKISPLTVDEGALRDSEIKATRLFSSSDRAWEMKNNINLNPMFISPPEDGEKRKFDLAYMLEGDFSSYFAGREIPQRKLPEESLGEENLEEESLGEENLEDDSLKNESLEEMNMVDHALSNIQASTTMVERSNGGKIFVMACSSMLEDNLLDSEGRSTNATFVLNVLDHLNGQDDIAVMRSKNQTLNPLGQTSPAVRTFIKSSNIVGLPILAVLFGFGVWIRRRSRKQRIKKLFSFDQPTQPEE